MANLCNNFIQISGEGVSKIKEVLEANPSGRMFRALDKDYQGGDVVANVKRWGCKWDVLIDLDGMFLEEDYISMNIQTPWEPCNGFLRVLHEQYGVNVDNKYSESGNDYMGIFSIDSKGEKDVRYPFLEGLYHFDYESFLFEVEKGLDYADEVLTLDEWLSQFTYVTADDLDELKELYESI